jgi:hypothetical protein
MSVRSIAFKMPKPQRDLLIAHIDGPQLLAIGPETSTRTALIDRKLLRFDTYASLRPKNTIITALGREVLCAILGDYADALVRAGALTKVPPIVFKRSPKIVADDFDIEAVLAEAWRTELTPR